MCAESRTRLLARWRADACVGQLSLPPGRALRGGPARSSVASAWRLPSVPERCRPRSGPRSTHPSLAQFSQLNSSSKPVLDAVRAERGRNEGPAAARPAHGTVSAAVLPGQLLHDSQPCPETGVGAGAGRRGATAAARPNVVVHQKKTTMKAYMETYNTCASRIKTT